MRTRALLVAAMLLTAGLAGCLGFGGEDVNDAETASTDDQPLSNETNETANETLEEVEGASEPKIEVHWQNGTVAGQNTYAFGYLCTPCQDNVVTFNATNETTAIVAQVFWDADVELNVDLDVPSDPCETDWPTDNDCQPDMKTGASPVEYRITNPQDLHAGEWSFSVWPENNPSTPAEVTIVVGVFETEQPPTQWSRVPQS